MDDQRMSEQEREIVGKTEEMEEDAGKARHAREEESESGATKSSEGAEEGM